MQRHLHRQIRKNGVVPHRKACGSDRRPCILQAVAMPTEKATDYLTEFTNRWSALAVKKYKELGDYLLVKYLDGNIKKEKDGKFERTAEGMPAKPEFGGYDNAEYFRNIVEHTGDHFLVRKIPQEKK